ncbi:MAG: ABC transporter permease [Sulfurovum sp.]|nr:ABC transporter permease [Sulfurovum sp.]
MEARQPVEIFMAVTKALFIRELNMRFTSGKAGLFWTFFKPFMQVLVFVLIKVVIFGRASDNIDYAAFLALNFTAFNMFKNIISASSGAFNANKGLFVYKQVKPIDTIIARIFVEIFISGIIIVIFVFIGIYFDFDLDVKSLPMVALAFISIILFAFSFGLLVAVGNKFYQSIGKVVNILLTFLMFGSAVFYAIEMVPVEIQEYLLLNPLTHFMEMLHGNYFYVLDDRFVDYRYMALWTLSFLFLGMILYRKLEERIISE